MAKPPRGWSDSNRKKLIDIQNPEHAEASLRLELNGTQPLSEDLEKVRTTLREFCPGPFRVPGISFSLYKRIHIHLEAFLRFEFRGFSVLEFNH